jgi:hypothetical protein
VPSGETLSATGKISAVSCEHEVRFVRAGCPLGEKGKKGASNLTFVYLRAICNHARELYSKDNGEFTIFATNPVSRMVKVRKLNPEKPRTGRIPKDRIGHVWLTLQQRRANARDAEDRTAADWSPRSC